MSYDLFCYKQESLSPSLEEASFFLESLKNSDVRKGEKFTEIKNTVVTALIKANPHFEKFTLDYEKIAEFENSTIEVAKAKYTYVELNLQKSGGTIQITVEDNYVSVSWYGDDQLESIFEELNDYLRIIKSMSGYTVYDPQANRFFDPDNMEYIDQTADQ